MSDEELAALRAAVRKDYLLKTYGPLDNVCGLCGVTLFIGMKPQHIEWHENGQAPGINRTDVYRD